METTRTVPKSIPTLLFYFSNPFPTKEHPQCPDNPYLNQKGLTQVIDLDSILFESQLQYFILLITDLESSLNE